MYEIEFINILLDCLTFLYFIVITIVIFFSY